MKDQSKIEDKGISSFLRVAKDSDVQSVTRMSRLLTMMTECNQILVRANEESYLLEEICNSIIRDGGYRFVWIGLFEDPESFNLILLVQKGLSNNEFKTYRKSSHSLLNNQQIFLPVVQSGMPCLIKDVFNNPANKNWQTEAKKLNYKSFIVLPLTEKANLKGVLAIFSQGAEDFGEREVKFLVDLAGDLSFGLNSVRTKVNLKKAQEALLESQQMLQLVMDTIPVRLFWKDKNFKYLGCNKAFAFDAGLNSPEEIIGKNDFELSWKESAPLYRSDDTEIIKKNVSKINYEEPQVREDGTSLWLRTTKIPLQNKQGEIIGLFGSYEDITEKKKAEEALLENERRYKMATLAAQVGVWDLNLNSGEMYIDPILKAMLGYDDHELENRLSEWYKMIYPDDLGKFKAETDLYLQGKLPQLEITYRMIHREGQIKWFITRGIVLKDPNGKPYRLVGTHMDITKQMEAEDEKEKIHAQLLQAQKMEAVGTLAGGMAHDFNNLLTTIRGYTDLTLQHLKEEDPIFRNLKQIRKAVQRAGTLTNQLLLFSRKHIMEPVSLNVNGTIKNMLLLLERVIGENIRIKTELFPEVWKIWADEGNIEQVIMNLAVNSRDAMPNGGTITIRTNNVTIDTNQTMNIPKSWPGQFVKLTFSDTGTGMSNEVYQHLFEPFFTTKEQGKGTGLGLSVIYGIITQHQGWINVSTQYGKGTIFEIYLPASFLKQTSESKDYISKSTLQGNGEMILLVEDEEGIREFVGNLLKEKGFQVISASTVQEALKLFNDHEKKVDLLFTDVVLPDRSGLELVNDLTKIIPNLPVVLSSGYTRDKSNWEKIQELGYRFLKKPFSMNELLNAIFKSLEKK
jgi:two-component system cell cycle sensor histidine kinase/response regulator CckA